MCNKKLMIGVNGINMKDKNDINKIQDNKERNSHVGYGISFGLIGGAAFSTIIGFLFEFPLIWAFGPGFGMLIGIIIGAIMDSNENKE
jgi:uncharacterized membrane protein